MKIFFSEYGSDYGTYTFGYAVYCVLEERSELPEIYRRGFLPYTGDTGASASLFYLCRSLRVDLARFSDTSENRRLDRKAAELRIGLRAVPRADFDVGDPAFRRFCLEYAGERFSGGSMDAERLEYVLGREILTHLLVFEGDDRVYGYVYAAIEGEMLHYWYSFFDTEYLHSHSLGKWMMWRTLRWAADQGLRYGYLGTCYTPKALYKARDHAGVEFYDGVGWNSDLRVLKALCEGDLEAEARDRDLFKRAGEIPTSIFQRVREGSPGNE